MKKIYIAGKVTGLPFDECAQKFKAAADAIAAMGYEPVNPIEVVNNPDASWISAMRLCIASLMGCDAIYCLPCHIASAGALIEKKIATNVGMPVIHVLESLNGAKWNS